MNMKKLLLLSFVIFGLMTTQNLFAQVGLRTGINVANLNGYSFDSRVAFRAGAYYGFELMDKIKVEPGLYFSQKGIKSDVEAVNDRLSYIDVPVVVRYGVTEKLNVFAGPQASVLAARRFEGPDGVSRATSTIRGYDLAAVLGVAYEIYNGVGIQVGYDFGLIDLNYFDTNVKSRVFHFSVNRNF
ncbi:outer membrane protein with beta-barrel domain [Mongoliibacter ruber]|uniref:Outer membrane protein with beta-barrel domain n=2 Tax=Mongoliibacter ruber TaxID=1750599 RepID=A0A2T0WLT2_9BACT|nr:outer membrane protein with beta-barrel domain [Mongoliibacter ruber]